MKNVVLSLVGLLMFIGCEGNSTIVGSEDYYLGEPNGYVCNEYV